MKRVLFLTAFTLVGMAGVLANTAEPNTVLEAYMKLKDALVESNVAAAQTAATNLAEALEENDMSVALVTAAERLASTDNLEGQRTAFKIISDGLIKSFQENDAKEGVFVQHCPMAFGNTGGSWLSQAKEIRNPYYGDAMLKCGRVEQEL